MLDLDHIEQVCTELKILIQLAGAANLTGSLEALQEALCRVEDARERSAEGWIIVANEPDNGDGLRLQSAIVYTKFSVANQICNRDNFALDGLRAYRVQPVKFRDSEPKTPTPVP